jgi:hypothetical protein
VGIGPIAIQKALQLRAHFLESTSDVLLQWRHHLSSNNWSNGITSRVRFAIAFIIVGKTTGLQKPDHALEECDGGLDLGPLPRDCAPPSIDVFEIIASDVHAQFLRHLNLGAHKTEPLVDFLDL